MCNYYTKFVPIVCTYCYTALQSYLWKTTKFDWTRDFYTAFNQLKHALVHTPVLAMPDSDASFVVETDASDVVVGAVLMQYDQPVAFISKALNSAQHNYHTMDHDLLAIVLACKRWRPYLDGKKTIVLIDHKPLIGIHTAPT